MNLNLELRTWVVKQAYESDPDGIDTFTDEQLSLIRDYIASDEELSGMPIAAAVHTEYASRHTEALIRDPYDVLADLMALRKSGNSNLTFTGPRGSFDAEAFIDYIIENVTPLGRDQLGGGLRYLDRRDNLWKPESKGSIDDGKSTFLDTALASLVGGVSRTIADNVRRNANTRPDLQIVHNGRVNNTKIFFTNGKYDLADGSFTPIVAEDGVTETIPYPYNPDADCPKMRSAQMDWFPNEPRTRKFLMLEAGLSIFGTSITYHEYAGWHKGPAGAGKSVHLEALQEIAGTKNTASVPPSTIDSGENFTVIQLLDKTLNMDTDVGLQKLNGSGNFKKVVSKETLNDRTPYGQPVQFKPTAYNVFATNNNPYSADRSFGLWRRIVAVKWDRIAVKRVTDPATQFLKDERIKGLKNDPAEMEGFIAHGVSALQEYFNQYLAGVVNFERDWMPEGSQSVMMEWRAVGDPIIDFIAHEELVRSPGSVTNVQDAWENYRQFLDDKYPSSKPMNIRRFAERTISEFADRLNQELKGVSDDADMAAYPTVHVDTVLGDDGLPVEVFVNAALTRMTPMAEAALAADEVARDIKEGGDR